MGEYFPVAFIYFFDDFECSQTLQFNHDQEMDIIDFYQFGRNLIGWVLFSWRVSGM